MQTPQSTISEATVDHVPNSLPPALAEGLELAEALKEKAPTENLTRWLAQHPQLAGDLARFLADEHLLKSRLHRALKGDAVGNMVGKYELREILGRGGMGVVYRAYDPDLKREVALKRVLAGSVLSPDELARFRREAESSASLEHPNVVRVLDYGESKDGPYLVMTLMERSLAEWLKSLGPDRLRPWMEAAEIVRDIAMAVHHAHQSLLLHRDLKPANILLDQDNRPHVADFGLARSLEASMTTGVAGTYAYMAPEQVRGEKVLTTAVDIHALGAVLFELLTGTPPFGAGDIGTVAKRITEEPAPPIRRFRADVPRDLEAICVKCLAKRPDERYESAAALADDLQRLLDHQPVFARSRGWLAEVVGAFGWRRDVQSLITWKGLITGALNHLAFHGTVAALVFAAAPVGWAATVLWLHLASWAVFVWWYAIRRKDALSPVERGATALMIGMIIAMASVLWIYLRGPEPNVAALYPFYNVVIGVGVFAYGAIHWGRFYLLGLALMAQNVILPFLPLWAWPAQHAMFGGVIYLWTGYRLWQLDRSARAKAPA